METKNKYEEFNREFQYEGVKALIESTDLLPRIYKVLNQNCFADTWLKTVVGVIKDIYKSTGLVPSYKELKGKLIDKKDENEVQYYIETLEKIRNSNEVRPAIIEEELIAFFRAKHRLAAANEFLKDAVFDDKAVKKLQKKLEEASDLGYDGSIETVIDDDTIMKALMQDDEDFIPTFIPGLDKYINGGLQRGSIGLFMAPTGLGKTTFARALTHQTAINGYKSLLIYFEDNPMDMVRADIAIDTGASTKNLKGFNEEKSRKLTNKYINEYSQPDLLKENKRMCKMLDKKTDVDDIENKIKDYINQGFRPDVLVIDYFNCLKFSSNYNKKEYQGQAEAMRYLVNLAQKYNMAIWVTQQTTAAGLNPDTKPSMDLFLGGKEATHPSTIFIQLVKTEEQYINNKADLVLLKVRGTKHPPVLENVIYDNGKCIIDCTKAETPSSRLAFDENEQPPHMRLVDLDQEK